MDSGLVKATLAQRDAANGGRLGRREEGTQACPSLSLALGMMGISPQLTDAIQEW